MPRPRKYDGGGKTISFYAPLSLIETLNTRARELQTTRGEVIVRTLQGRAMPPPEQETPPPVVEPVVEQGGPTGLGKPRETPCSHPSVLHLGMVTRCVNCGEAIAS